MSEPQAARVPPALPPLADFSHVMEDILRLSDLDFQQHVNNVTFNALLANARYDYLGVHVRGHLEPGAKLVLARLEVDFTGELHYGKPVHTGTRRIALGRTSMRLEQVLYQDGRCAARAVAAFVHVGASGKSAPWPAAVGATS